VSESELLYDWLFTANQFVLAPTPWDSRLEYFFSNWTPAVRVLSDERMGLSFTIAAGPHQRIHSQVWVPQDSCPHFTVSDSRLPQPGVQVPVFISPRNRVAQLYPPALGSIFVALYDSQGYGGGCSNPPPHPEGPVCYALTHKFEEDQIKNTA
jgi:hypothetical protein